MLVALRVAVWVFFRCCFLEVGSGKPPVFWTFFWTAEGPGPGTHSHMIITRVKK
jgi:hypothetical protein